MADTTTLLKFQQNASTYLRDYTAAQRLNHFANALLPDEVARFRQHVDAGDGTDAATTLRILLADVVNALADLRALDEQSQRESSDG